METRGLLVRMRDAVVVWMKDLLVGVEWSVVDDVDDRDTSSEALFGILVVVVVVVGAKAKANAWRDSMAAIRCMTENILCIVPVNPKLCSFKNTLVRF